MKHLSAKRLVLKSTVLFGYVCLFSLLATLVQAWGARGEESTAAEFIAGCSARLQLSEKQQARLRPVLEAAMEQKQTLIRKYRSQGNRDRRALKAELERIDQSAEDRLEKVLSTEQLAEFQTYQQEFNSHRRGKGSVERRSH